MSRMFLAVRGAVLGALTLACVMAAHADSGPSAPRPDCGTRTSDWCPAPAGDPCGAHPDEKSCRADARCRGLPYRGESVVACLPDGHGFWSNCPAVGCVSPADPAADTDVAKPAANRVRRSCPTAGITRVILRADGATEAKVVRRPGDTIEMSGDPSGGAKGYHSSDPNWKETPASQWGLDFVCKAYGSTLVVSSKNEIHYIHDSYWLGAIALAVPPGIDVTRERRTLSGDGAPDLQPPRKSGPQH